MRDCHDEAPTKELEKSGEILFPRINPDWICFRVPLVVFRSGRSHHPACFSLCSSALVPSLVKR